MIRTNPTTQITQLLPWLIIKTKGGKTRAKIIKVIKKRPQNANQLATKLNVDYKTIRHHITVLEKYKLIVPIGDHYSTVYFLSQTMEENYPAFEQITNKTVNVKKAAIKIAQ